MATAQSSYTTMPSVGDPYKYQPGFGNQVASEAIPGTLVPGQNTPQNVKGDLYIEGITGSCFTAPRAENLNAFLYRIRPSMDWSGYKPLDNDKVESCFLPYNSRVHIKHDMFIMEPIDIPGNSVKVDFIDGLQTAVGGGDVSMREGVAVHLYVANASMTNRAFQNADGDLLIIPQVGRLDVQTEFGKIMVKPGEFIVVQKDIKFCVGLPDDCSRGYVHEIYGSHWELPELGLIGGHGLANPLDFQRPVAHFDLDETSWQVVVKHNGRFFSYTQTHTPFDVVAWKGSYVPYKYNLSNFVFVRSVSKDHLDPSLYIVLTAKSKATNIPLADFGSVGPFWDVTENTFRPAYYHRNNATEIVGLLKSGDLGGVGDQAAPGGLRVTNVFTPHGIPYPMWKAATSGKQKPEVTFSDMLIFFVETSLPVTFTDFAIKRATANLEAKAVPFEGAFNANVDKLNEELKGAGLKEMIKA